MHAEKVKKTVPCFFNFGSTAEGEAETRRKLQPLTLILH